MWKKLLALALIGMIPIIGPFLVLVVVFGYIDILIISIFLAAILRFFSWPIRKFFSTTLGIGRFFHHGVTEVENHPKKFGGLGFTLMAFLVLVFGPGSISLDSLGFETAIWIVFLLMVPGMVVILLASIYYRYSDRQRSAADLSGVAAGGTAAAGAAEAARQGGRMYRDIREVQDASEDFGFLEAMVAKFIDEAPVVGSLVEGIGGEAAAGEAAAAGVGAVGAGTIVGAIVAGIILFLLQFALFIVLIIVGGIIFGPIIGSTLEPVFSSIGLGTQWLGMWAGYFGDVAGDEAAVAENELEDSVLGETVSVYRQSKARVFCVLKGPTCLRQWRLNHTTRPGSEDRGEEYGLEISELEAGAGDTIDIAAREPTYQIPLQFNIYNVRHGLKGVNAYDVQYRVRMVPGGEDFSDYTCRTDWLDAGAQDVDDDDDESPPDDLLPGVASTTGLEQLPEISLKKCGLLQPGTRQGMNIYFEVRYDYSSQSSINFRALPVETVVQNPDIDIAGFKESFTADTPVKSYINVKDPVTFSRDDSNQEITFQTQMDLYTEDSDVRFKVKPRGGKPQDLVVEMPRYSEVPDSGLGCDLEPIGEDTYRLDSQRIVDIQTGREGKDNQRGEWWREEKTPGPFICEFALDVSGISSSGETLSARIDANYSVVLEDEVSSIEVLNSRCTTYNCPLIVTTMFDENDNSYDWKTECDGWDAGDGCTIVEGPEENNDERSDWGEIVPIHSEFDTKMERGEIAVDLRDEAFTRVQISNSEEPIAIGLDPRDWEKVKDGSQDYALVSEDNDVDFRSIDDCEDLVSIEDDDNEKLIDFRLESSSCDVTVRTAGTESSGGSDSGSGSDGGGETSDSTSDSSSSDSDGSSTGPEGAEIQ